jgi:hypothetical protein
VSRRSIGGPTFELVQRCFAVSCETLLAGFIALPAPALLVPLEEEARCDPLKPSIWPSQAATKNKLVAPSSLSAMCARITL